MDDNQENRWLGGIIAGGILGAFIGFLWAPAKGEATRSKIKEKLETFQLDSNKLIEEGMSRFAYIMAEAQKAAANKKAELEKDNELENAASTVADETDSV